MAAAPTASASARPHGVWTTPGLSEPTRGMDVGAKDDVVKIVKALRDDGIGVLVVSTEPETVLSLADRILIMKKGAIVREFSGATVSKDQLLDAA